MRVDYNGLFYFNVIADTTKLGLWVLDGDPTHTGLLKYALTADNFKDTLIMVVASMSQPWSILKSLTNWLNIITDHIDRIGISHEVMQQCKQKCKPRFVRGFIGTETRHIFARMFVMTKKLKSCLPLL